MTQLEITIPEETTKTLKKLSNRSVIARIDLEVGGEIVITDKTPIEKASKEITSTVAEQVRQMKSRKPKYGP